MRKKSTACCSRVGIKKGPWTPEEDEILTNYIKREGEGRWRTLPENAGLLRCGKSCRLRWMNYLRPNVKRGQITPQEEELILRLHRLLGNRWSLIAGRIPGRTDNEIKNYWNTHLSKKLISQGVDPRTHMPLEPDQTYSMAHPTMNDTGLNTNVDYHIPTPPGLDQNRINGYHEISTYQYPSQLFYPNIIYENNQMATAISNPYPMNMQGSKENYYGDKEGSHESQYVYEEISAGTEGSHGNQEEDMLEYCIKDEAFSSFLTSLMNEEDLKNQQQQQQPIVGIAAAAAPEPAMIYGYGNHPYYLDSEWETAASTGITSTNTSVDPKQNYN